MILAGRLDIPDETTALLLDMDGVLLDTLGLDYEVVNALVGARFNADTSVPRSVIRANFPYDIPEFWRRILSSINVDARPEVVAQLSEEHEALRRRSSPKAHDGVKEILAAARASGMGIAVVSNNPTSEVEAILSTAGLGTFDVIVGNDDVRLAKKPAPDTYLEAARRLTVLPSRCAAIEDSLLGVEAAARSGCHVIGVSTGACDFEQLSSSPYVCRCYSGFLELRCLVSRGDTAMGLVTTPYPVLSELLQHLAESAGLSFEVMWTNDDWHPLGALLGRRVAQVLGVKSTRQAAGVAKGRDKDVQPRGAADGNVSIRVSSVQNPASLLAARVGQLSSGIVLSEILNGFAFGCGVQLQVTTAAVEDVLKLWEKIFNSVGCGLRRMAST